MISRREFITGAGASVALTAFSKTHKQILQWQINPKCKPGEIYRIIWGDYPGFDFPDWQEYLYFCCGYKLACYSEELFIDFKDLLFDGELLYFFHPITHLHDFGYTGFILLDSDFSDLVKFQLVVN